MLSFACQPALPYAHFKQPLVHIPSKSLCESYKTVQLSILEFLSLQATNLANCRISRHARKRCTCRSVAKISSDGDTFLPTLVTAHESLQQRRALETMQDAQTPCERMQAEECCETFANL